MSNIGITPNHPHKKRRILQPISKLDLRLFNWDIVGTLPDKKRIILTAIPHTAITDSWYAFFVCFSLNLKFHFLASVAIFTRISLPWSLKKHPDLDKHGFLHPFSGIQKKLLTNMGGIPVYQSKEIGVTDQVIEELRKLDSFILYLTVEGSWLGDKKIKSGFHYISKALNATVVPTKIDFKNRNHELMEPFELTDDIEKDIHNLAKLFDGVEGKNSTFNYS